MVAPVTVTFPAPIGGVRLDMNPLQMAPDALITSTNLVYRQGRVKPRWGIASLGSDIGSTARGVISLGSSSAASWRGAGTADAFVAGCDNGWYTFSAGTWTGLTGALSASNHVIFRIFSKSGTGYVVGLNDGNNAPKKWDGVGAAISDVGGNPPKARAMMMLANRLILFNLTANGTYSGVISPVGYDVSAFNDFESGWSTTLNGLLIDTPGDIVAALEMGDLQGVVYKSDAIVMMVAQGGAVPFHFEWKTFGNVGPANSRCVVAVNDGSHVFLGADGALYRFDGVGAQHMGAHIQRCIQKYMDQDYTKLASNAWAFYDRTRNEVVVFFKTGLGSINSVMVNLTNLSVWPQSYVAGGAITITAGGLMFIPGSTVGQQVVLLYGATGVGWKENYVATDVGNSISVSWTQGYTDGGLPGQTKTLREINSKFTTNQDVHDVAGSQSVLVGAAVSAGGDVEGGASYETITVSTGGGQGGAYVANMRQTFQFIGAQYIVAATTTLAYDGCDLTFVPRGRR
jgi:hypothetical protein